MTNVQVAADGDLLTICVDLGALAKDLSRQVEEWQHTAERTRIQWEESEWYLGEAKASITELEEQLRVRTEAYGELEARHREVTVRLQDAERERDEATWYLGESRAAQEELLRRIELQRAPLVQAEVGVEELRRATDGPQHALEVEQAQSGTVAAELAAVGTRADRRRDSRTFRRDLTVEFQRPNGAVLFRGQPRDVSHTGVGFVSEHPIDDAAGFVWVSFLLPGVDRPIEATGRVAWQGPEATWGNLGGCEMLDMSPGCREAFERVLANTA